MAGYGAAVLVAHAGRRLAVGQGARRAGDDHAPVTGAVAEPGLCSRHGQFSVPRRTGSKRRVLKTEYRARSHTPRKRAFWFNPLILNGLSQLDDYWTRSSKNGEYGPRRG